MSRGNQSFRKGHFDAAKEPCKSTKEPYDSAKEPDQSAKEPCDSTRELCDTPCELEFNKKGILTHTVHFSSLCIHGH